MNLKPEVAVVFADAPLKGQVVIHQPYQFTGEGVLATEIAKVICAAPHVPEEPQARGVGFQRWRKMTGEEVAELAVDIARSLYARVKAEGWTLEMPPLSELQRETKNQAGFRKDGQD